MPHHATHRKWGAPERPNFSSGSPCCMASMEIHGVSAARALSMPRAWERQGGEWVAGRVLACNAGNAPARAACVAEIDKV